MAEQSVALSGLYVTALWFFSEAGVLLGCAAKPTGYSEVAVQGLSSLLEQNLKRWLRMKARRAGNTDKGFEGFCYKKNKYPKLQVNDL